MTRTRSASVANFVCRFGDQHVLLDMADTVVIPAFVTGGQRMYAESRYIIQETTIENFGTESNPALVLVGRFINDTTMKRQQVLRAGKIVKSPATLESAPSAAFALVLDTHKLIYLPEAPHAPALSAFRATIAHLLTKRHKVFLDAVYADAEGRRRKITRKQLIEKYPYPSLEIVPMSSTQDFEKFLAQFKILQQVRIDLIDTNNEVDGLDLVQAARSIKDGVNAKGVSIAYRNPKGLLPSHALDRFGIIANEGNTKLTLIGKDKAGDKLDGNNDKFKMAIPIETDSSDPIEIGRELFGTFKKKIKSGLLEIKLPSAEVREKIVKLARKLKGT